MWRDWWRSSRQEGGKFFCKLCGGGPELHTEYRRKRQMCIRGGPEGEGEKERERYNFKKKIGAIGVITR